MVFDKTLPIEGALAPTYNNIMRANQTALEAALNAYMYFATGGTQTGQPRQGSSRPYYQASAPSTRLDGDYFDSTDYGTPWIDSDNGKLYFLTSANGAGTDVWTLASTEIIATLVAAAHTWAEVQAFSKAAVFSVSPTFTLGIVANNTTIKARNAAGDGNADLIKVDGNDKACLPDGAVVAAATQSGDGARTLADKTYVDDGGLRAVNAGTAVVHTKYFTGNLDADTATSVAHGIATGKTKIYAMSACAYDDNIGGYVTIEAYKTASGDNAIVVYFDDNNVVFSGVGAFYQGNGYKIKIDYID